MICTKHNEKKTLWHHSVEQHMMWREERSIKFITTIWMRNAVFRKHGCVTPAFATRIVWWSEKCVVLKHEKYLNHPIFFLWPCLSFMHVFLSFTRMLQVVHLCMPMRTFYQWQPHTSFSVTLQQRFQHLKVFLGRLCNGLAQESKLKGSRVLLTHYKNSQ